MVRGSLFSLWLDRWSCFIPLGLPGVEWAAVHGFCSDQMIFMARPVVLLYAFGVTWEMCLLAVVSSVPVIVESPMGHLVGVSSCGLKWTVVASGFLLLIITFVLLLSIRPVGQSMTNVVWLLDGFW